MQHLSYYGDVGCHLQPTKESDTYISFGILAYEVVFQTETWPIVNFQLIPSVKLGIIHQYPAMVHTYYPFLVSHVASVTFPGKVSLVIEPVIAVIINQIDVLQGLKYLHWGILQALGKNLPIIVQHTR